MTDLSIVGLGGSYRVLADGRAQPGHYTSAGNAIAALPGVQRRLRPISRRACLCCGQAFNSLGRGNRLCQPCKEEMA